MQISFEQLFPPINKVEIAWKVPNQDTIERIKKICINIGLTSEITSIHQPLSSAEINSQNYRIALNSGEKLLLRCCSKYSGLQRYTQLNKLFKELKEEGVSAPEIVSFDGANITYFEETLEVRVSWVFFKYIEADGYFSGGIDELREASRQVGKMHRCLKNNFGKEPVLPMNAAAAQTGPFLPAQEWQSYLEKINSIQEKDEYDTLILENRTTIEKMVAFVEENYTKIEDEEDVQNIHFDLNSSNFLVQENQVFIMDFDNLSIGNIYTDIAFAFHRLITTSLQRGERTVEELLTAFLTGYREGNREFDCKTDKLIVAACNRALWNIRTNLSLKYEKNSKEWLSSIPINIKRLKQVDYIVSKVS